MSELERRIGEIRIAGNLLDAGRVRELGEELGAAALPFLLNAARVGSIPVAAAALTAAAEIDPRATADLALGILADPRQAPDVRASAAESLAQVHTHAALEALLSATEGSPLVSRAAWAALRQHEDRAATDRIRALLSVLLVREPDPSSSTSSPQRRCVELMALLEPRAVDGWRSDLRVWWRSHPDVSVQAEAARQLTAASVADACAILREGLPRANDALPSGTGELDNGPVRHALAHAAHRVIASSGAEEAFHHLAPFMEPAETGGWLGRKRAEIILLLLLGQAGDNRTSWLWGDADALHRSGVRPHPRWRLAGAELRDPALSQLLDDLRGRLEPICG